MIVIDEENEMREESPLAAAPLLAVSDESNTATEKFSPEFDSPLRMLSPSHATIVLLASMLGGGMLTLPFATSKLGIIGSLLVSLCAALMSEQTYTMVLLSARTFGTNSFHDTALHELGKRGQVLSMISMVLLTLMAAMSYILLLGSIFQEFIPLTRVEITSGYTCCLLLPLSTLETMHVMKRTNVLAAVSAVILLAAICLELFFIRQSPRQEDVKWIPSSLDDFLFGLPFFITAYLCHFSLLGMQSELQRPTQRRVKIVTQSAVAVGFVLYSLIGGLGYLMATRDEVVCDSVLNNLSNHSVRLVLGRMSLILCLTLSFPLFVLPTRSMVCDLLKWRANELKVRLGISCAFCACCLLLAYTMPSVAIAFSLSGSTVGILVGMILPSLFAWNRQFKTSRFVLILAVVLMTLCTYTIWKHRNDKSVC